ncbi:hypothetical protein [Streptomyces ziwulingensis]|uniref:Uncharacterized protein n=1 Tax=Streptomyces ziwulingensis TaxID=1045501 RepID=A0ABP9B361_9ACTN
MNDASTNQSMGARGTGADVQAGAMADGGRGRHRGPVTQRDGETAPQGRHRKPAQGSGTAA